MHGGMRQIRGFELIFMMFLEEMGSERFVVRIQVFSVRVARRLFEKKRNCN